MILAVVGVLGVLLGCVLAVVLYMLCTTRLQGRKPGLASQDSIVGAADDPEDGAVAVHFGSCRAPTGVTGHAPALGCRGSSCA